MQRILAIAFIAAGLIALPLAFADDYGESGRYDQSGSSRDMSKDQSDLSGRPISDNDDNDEYDDSDPGISGRSISDEASRQGGFGATTTRPARSDQETGARGNVRNYSERDIRNLNLDDRFIVSHYQENLFEVKAAQLVADQTRSDEIRRFARRIADDHRQANERLRLVAERRNVALPDGVASWQQGILDHMSQMNRIELGRKFVFHQVGAHNVNILELQWVANHSRNSDVRQLAERMSNQLEQHLQVACGLATSMTEGREGQARIDNP